MSSPCTLFGPCNCASCRPGVPNTPLATANKPGRKSLQYRVGTFSTFRQAMLDYLVQKPVMNPSPADASQTFTLTSRSSDDYGVAMLELWAYVCDVLTFYQQSIANEAFLRTATQQASVVRLAALLGYRPAPPVAASTYLAFLMSKNAQALIPAGTQAQSVPPPGAKPAIFETSSALNATVVNNQPVLLGPEISLTLDQSGILIVDDPATPLAKGSRVLFFDTSAPLLSEQQVTAVTQQSPGKLVEWRGRLNGIAASTTAYRAGRTFRCFGANAPPTYFGNTAPVNATPSWGSLTTKFALESILNGSNYLWLDAVYSGLGVGSPLLIEYTAGAAQKLMLGKISSTMNGSVAVGPLAGSATGIMFDSGPLPSSTDLRSITVYELLGPPLIFAGTGFDSSAAAAYPANTQLIYVLDASAMQDRTQIALASANEDGAFGDAAVVAGTPVAIQESGVVLGYAVKLKRALANAYTVSETQLFANVAAATQGKSQPMETLGSGDASQVWQEFALKGKPVTYVPNAAAERGAASTLQVFVNNVRWTEVDSFFGRGPNDQVYVTRVADDGTVSVRFGDGVTGQRLPTGNRNVTALYRTGAGSSGDVDADAVSILLGSVQGVQSVINPSAGVGGNDGEAIEQTRENAPVSVLTLGRAVSLRDYEAIALTYLDGAITKARASWTELNDRRGVSLTAAAAGGTPLGQLAQPLRDFLDQHRDPNVPLAITDVTEVTFALRAVIHVRDGYLQSAVKAGVEAALGVTGDDGYVSYKQLQIGESVYQSKLLAVMQDAAGVDWVQLERFSTEYSAGDIGFSPLGNYGPPALPPGPPGRKRLEVIYINPQQIAKLSLLSNMNNAGFSLTYSGGVNDLQ